MTAAEIFEREEICSLPLDPVRLARQNGVRLVTYATYTAAKASGASLPSNDGFLVRGASSPVIVYNEIIASAGRQRWTLIHELCHLWMGHESSDPRTEREVERLTAELISPLTVMHLCGVSNAAQLCALCGVSAEAGRIRFGELQRRRAAKNFFDRDEDRRIAVRFLPYISGVVCELTDQRIRRGKLRSADIFQRGEFG